MGTNRERFERYLRVQKENYFKAVKELREGEEIGLEVAKTLDELELGQIGVSQGVSSLRVGEFGEEPDAWTSRKVREKLSDLLEIWKWEKGFDGWCGYEKPRWYWEGQGGAGYKVRIYGAPASEECKPEKVESVVSNWVCKKRG